MRYHESQDDFIGEEGDVIEGVIELESQLKFLEGLIQSLHAQESSSDIPRIINSIESTIEIIEAQLQKIEGVRIQIKTTIEYEISQIRYLLQRESRMKKVLRDQEEIVGKMELISAHLENMKKSKHPSATTKHEAVENIRALFLLIAKMKSTYREVTKQAEMVKISEDQIQRIIMHLKKII